jgi:cytochrome oxidase assembly protein ShyY1
MKMLRYILVSPFVSYGAKSCLEEQSELKQCRTLDINIYLCFGFFIWICLFMLVFFQLRRRVQIQLLMERKDDAPTPSESKNSKKKKNKIYKS